MLAWLRTVHRRMRAYFSDLRTVREESLPYLTRFTITCPASLDSLKLSDFPGLLFLQYVENQTGIIEVIAYWKSHETEKSNRLPLEKSLKAGDPEFEGYLRQFKGRKRAWWRIPLGRWLLYAASLFGALAVLQTHFAKLLESPDVTLEISGPRVLNTLTADEISLEVAITNRSREVYSLVTLSSPQVHSSIGRVPINHRFWGNFRPAPIGPADNSVALLKGDPLPTGTYDVTITAEARTGYLRRPKQFSFTKKLRAWSRDPVARFTSLVPGDTRRASLKGQVSIGTSTPNGLSCQATMERQRNVEFVFLDFPGVLNWETHSTVDTRSITFATSRSFDSLADVPFEISIDSAVEMFNWEPVLEQAHVECIRIEETR